MIVLEKAETTKCLHPVEARACDAVNGWTEQMAAEDFEGARAELLTARYEVVRVFGKDVYLALWQQAFSGKGRRRGGGNAFHQKNKMPES